MTDDDVAKLTAANGDAAVKEIIQEDIEERWDEKWLQETDKAWDAMHRCLTNGTLICKGKSVLEKCVLGGKQLYQGSEYIISFLTPAEVKEVFEALRPIEKNLFRENFFGLRKKFLWFDLTKYEGPLDEDDFEYTWSYFEKARKLFEKASKAGRAMIFTVDQ